MTDTATETATAAAAPSTHVPAHEVPIPSTLSPEAQGVLAMLLSLPATDFPDPADGAAWRALIDGRTFNDSPEFVAAMAMACTGAVPSEVAAEVEEITVGDATVYIATPEGHDPADERVHLTVHGGGFTEGGGPALRKAVELLAGNYGLRVWGVDYRMPPEQPFPAGLDDCVAAYRALLEDHEPSTITVGGLSAGGNLVAAMLLRARDEGLPMPAAAVLYSPVADLTEAGDSVVTNRFAMVGYDSLAPIVQLYAGSNELTDPYLSPVFGDFTAEWPPSILITGTRDFLLSDTVRMHRALRAAGVDAELHVFEAGPHGLFGGHTPEDRVQAAEVRAFLEKHLPA